MKKFILNLLATFVGVGLLSIMLCIIEGVFIANKYLHLMAPPQYRNSKAPWVPYDLSSFDLGYLKNIAPYSGHTDLDEPNDYSDTYKFADCPEKQMHMDPYWIGAPNCTNRAILKKKYSRRVVYDTSYSFDENGLRRIPTASSSSRFLLFLGCSYTFGEGQPASKTFSNLITKELAPINAFNLGMMGYGPHLLLQLLENKNDIRLRGITGDSGIAIYTYIDDHFRRMLGSATWLKDGNNLSNPYFVLDNGNAVQRGTFLSGRPFYTELYQLLSKSETLSFFGIDIPTAGNQDIQLFSKIILKIKEDVKLRFHVNEFIFSIYPGERFYAYKLKPILEANGITVFDFSNVGLQELMKGRQYIFGNGHPSDLAHKFYADLVLHELKARNILSRPTIN